MEEHDDLSEEEKELEELDSLQNIFDDIFKAPETQREKIEFIIMVGVQLPHVENVIEQLRKDIEMKMKRKYKQ